MLEVDGV